MEQTDSIEEMKEMIQSEIQSIDSLQERAVFKELMEGVFLSLYETNLKMYEKLEQRVQEELGYDQSRYKVKTGIIEKEYFDASHHFLSPMEEYDLQERHYDMEDIIRSVEEEGAFPLMKVMLCCDYLELQKIWERNPIFKGSIQTEGAQQEWEIDVQLRENREYIQKIQYLYQLFIKNGIPWQTINAPYLYKMADVVITKLPEGIYEEFYKKEKIKQVTIQFEEYSQIVRKDLIPVWNLQKLTLDGIGFPTPCGDHKNYEHNISIHAYGMEHAYLVEDDQKIRSVSHIGEKLRIISESSEAKKWNVYMLRATEDLKIDRYTYPLMQNGRSESFSEKYQKKWNQNIRTRTELVHFIKGFGFEDYVLYQDCKIAEQFPSGKETYSMNPFLIDEIRDSKAQIKLILYFSPGQRETWIQRDILSFLTSEVQRIYPEYECGGILS